MIGLLDPMPASVVQDLVEAAEESLRYVCRTPGDDPQYRHVLHSQLLTVLSRARGIVPPDKKVIGVASRLECQDYVERKRSEAALRRPDRIAWRVSIAALGISVASAAFTILRAVLLYR